MNYPVWELGALGGGFWIALVAVTHVFVSHFAVGGGLWLVMTERKARKENDPGLLDYVKSHGKFFLLLTMVFGGMSGVGIWWTISLLNPAATSSLIHTFVFGWAAEWVCFAGEIVALLIYYYRFDTMKPRDHEIIGWFYFVFAWLSLFLINGIIGFMLTPGRFLETGNFWHGFFNESFWPALVFRSALCFMIAGMFGFLTSAWRRDDAERYTLLRYNALWVIVPFVAMIAGGWWYLQAMPEPQASMIAGRAREVLPYMTVLVWLSPVLLIGAVLLTLKLPRAAQRVLTVGILVVGFLHMGSFEFVREAGRRPWVIHGVMYSNSVLASDAARLQDASFLEEARWTSHESVTDANRLEVGREIFLLQCTACHSIGGPLNDIRGLSRGFTEVGLAAQLSGQGKVTPYMPPFFGNAAEREAVAAYLVQTVQGRTPESGSPTPQRDLAFDIPPFDPDNDEYVLLAWSTMGMRSVSDSDPWFMIQPPGTDLHAQLILRGETPEVIVDDVTITYQVEPDFAHPENEVSFWEHARANFSLGGDLEVGLGLSGNRVNGAMALDEERVLFAATGIPVVPYANGAYNPYPLFTIEARDASSGELLASTLTVAPASTDMGCALCHGGGSRVDGAGFTEETSRRILAAHDKHSGTRLLAEAPQLCQSCHADPLLETSGESNLLGFSAAMHGWHANFMVGRGADACAMCHASDPAGPTSCFRGGHARQLDCTSCHGTLEDHALSLLKPELALGKPGAERLMKHLQPRSVSSVSSVVGRTPWLEEPDCLACHTDEFERPTVVGASAFNEWTSELYRLSTDESGLLQCQGCHGATHATYPALNMWFGLDRDNVAPLQYQGNRRPIGAGGACTVCHGMEMEDSIHHPGMEEIQP